MGDENISTLFIPKTVFWTNVGKIVLIYFLKILVQDLATFPKFAS